MTQPEAVELRGQLSDRLINHFTDFAEIFLPDGTILEEIDVHEFDDHVRHVHVDFAEAAVLGDQLRRLGLDLLDVVFNFNRVVPSHCARSPSDFAALWVFDERFELSSFLEHHGFLAVNHLRAH